MRQCAKSHQRQTKPNPVEDDGKPTSSLRELKIHPYCVSEQHLLTNFFFSKQGQRNLKN